MFSDLVGSTALSARLDPEDLREIISAYQKCVADTVQRFGGFAAKYMGDGVLVYFGYPQAHEDDAETAVHAACCLQSDHCRDQFKRVRDYFIGMLQTNTPDDCWHSPGDPPLQPQAELALEAIV
jgi:class 3 adenylate cyclase